MIAEYDGVVSTVLPGGDGRSGGKLLLGAEQCAKDEALLRDLGVTHVVNCAGLACANHHPSSFTYLKLNLQDTAREDISAAFYDALDYIDAAIGADDATGCVFVHCQHGVSRSATIVIAYTMWRHGLSYDEALDAVRNARPTINPNIGFACALLQWGAAVSAPPTTLQAWAVQHASANDGSTPLAEESLSSAQGGSGLAMRSVLLPASLLPALSGVAPPLEGEDDSGFDDGAIEACRGEVGAELRRHGLGCVVIQIGTTAACWLCPDAPAAALAEAQKLIWRLVRYHHLPPDAADPPTEHDGLESDIFWQLLRPRRPPSAAIESEPSGRGLREDSGASNASAMDEVGEVAEVMRRASMHEEIIGGGGGHDPSGAAADGVLPPMTATRAAARKQRGFGGFGGAPSGQPTLSLPLDSLNEDDTPESIALPPGAPLAIITPGSTDRSGDGTERATASSTAPVRSSPLHVAASASDLGEAMVLAVLQTVSSELLLLLQHEFDLLAPSPTKRHGPQPALDDASAAAHAALAQQYGCADAHAAASPYDHPDDDHPDDDEHHYEGDGVTELDPAHLLTICQELLLARPTTLDETHSVVASLSQLLSELAPHITHKPTLQPLASALTDFLAKLPITRGEGLMREEEVMLRAITRAQQETEQAEEALAEQAEADAYEQ